MPTDFISIDNPKAEDWASSHEIASHKHYDDGRIALSWDEVRELDRKGHIVGCHTKTHRRMTPDCPRETFDHEIFDSKRTLEAQLGHAVETFCWVGGETKYLQPLSFRTNSQQWLPLLLYHSCGPDSATKQPFIPASHRNIGRSSDRDRKVPTQRFDRSVVYPSEEADTKRVGS